MISLFLLVTQKISLVSLFIEILILVKNSSAGAERPICGTWSKLNEKMGNNRKYKIKSTFCEKSKEKKVL